MFPDYKILLTIKIFSQKYFGEIFDLNQRFGSNIYKYYIKRDLY